MKLFSRTGLAAAVTAAALSTTVLAAPAMAAGTQPTGSSGLVGMSSEGETGNDPEGIADLFSNLSAGEDDDGIFSAEGAGSIKDATSALSLVSVVLTVATAVIGLVGIL